MSLICLSFVFEVRKVCLSHRSQTGLTGTSLRRTVALIEIDLRSNRCAVWMNLKKNWPILENKVFSPLKRQKQMSDKFASEIMSLVL